MRSEVRYDSCMEQRLLDPVYGGTVRADRVEPGNLFAETKSVRRIGGWSGGRAEHVPFIILCGFHEVHAVNEGLHCIHLFLVRKERVVLDLRSFL